MKKNAKETVATHLHVATAILLLFVTISIIWILVLGPGSSIGEAFYSFSARELTTKIQPALQPKATMLYIAPNGNDRNPGTKEKPLATGEGARNAIRKLKFSSADGKVHKPVQVFVRQGTYRLQKPFILEGRDSGTETAPITYQSYPGEQAIISGGKRVTTPWTFYDPKRKIFVTNLASVLPEGMNSFNSLFVNGQRAIRARTPNDGHYRVLSWQGFAECESANTCSTTPFSGFRFTDGELRASWENLQDAEIVLPISFTQPRFTIQSIDEANDIVYLNSLRAYASGKMPPLSNADFYYLLRRYYVENALELLDSPGEWYFDKTAKDLYYKLKPGEDLNSPNTEIIIPTLKQLVRVQRDWDELNLPASFTINHWIKTPDLSIYTISNTGGYDGYSFGLANGNIQFIIGEGESSSEYTNIQCSPPDGVQINDNNWHMITGVIKRNQNAPENSKFTCYVDGRKGQEIPILEAYPNMQTRTPAVNPFPCAACGPDPTRTVAIDELRLYNRELSESEIQALYNGGSVSESLVLALSFKDNLKESSGSLQILRKYDRGMPEFTGGINGGKALLFGNVDGADAIVFPTDLASNINIKGLTFQYTDWSLPEEGYESGQAGINIPDEPAVNFYLAEDASFENNKILHTGSYGLSVYGKNVRVRNNELQDLGAGGLKIGSPNNWAVVGSNKQIVYEGGSNTISDNTVHDIGKVYPEGVGIWALLSGNNVITHNEIFDASYSGISVGWNWGTAETAAKNNTITYNNIHNILNVLSDGGGIYTLGEQPGTVISNNFVHDYAYTPDHVNLVAGIYLDESSSEMVVKNNLLSGAGATSFALGISFNNRIENNVFIDNQNSKDATHGQLQMRAYCGPDYANKECPSGNSFTRNIIYSSDPQGKFFIVDPQPVASLSNNVFFNPQNSSLLSYGQNSPFADPLFQDLSQGFELQPGSPAFALGFTGFDVLQDIGVPGPRE